MWSFSNSPTCYEYLASNEDSIRWALHLVCIRLVTRDGYSCDVLFCRADAADDKGELDGKEENYQTASASSTTADSEALEPPAAVSCFNF